MGNALRALKSINWSRLNPFFTFVSSSIPMTPSDSEFRARWSIGLIGYRQFGWSLWSAVKGWDTCVSVVITKHLSNISSSVEFISKMDSPLDDYSMITPTRRPDLGTEPSDWNLWACSIMAAAEDWYQDVKREWVKGRGHKIDVICARQANKKRDTGGGNNFLHCPLRSPLRNAGSEAATNLQNPSFRLFTLEKDKTRKGNSLWASSHPYVKSPVPML